ncbi:MAG: M66 family metalloprotease [Polyangiales bacterium]
MTRSRPLQRALQRACVAALALASGCVGEVYGGDPSEVTPPVDFDAGRQPSIPQQDQYELPRCDDGRDHPLARDIALRQVALYQTVKIPLFEGGRWVAAGAEAPIIAGKQALLRVFVEPLDDYDPRTLRAVVRIQSERGEATLFDERELSAASSDDRQTSTFNVSVDGDLLTPDARVSVTLEETDCDADAGDAADARAPTEGSAKLGAATIGNLRVVLVPLEVDGRVPKLSEAAQQRIRAALLAFYPVPRVELKVHDPLDIGGEVGAQDRDAWSALLQRIRELRQREVPDEDVYYVGLFQPAASRAAYCAKRGCVLGLAPQAKEVLPSAQYAAVAYFEDEKSGESVVHELGHAHGLGHVRCAGAIQADGIDADYPFADGSIGDWGWDSRRRTLMSPDLHDVMSYCDPYGMSAYHYRRLAERAEAVNVKGLALRAAAAGTFRELLVSPDGPARWGAIAAAEPPSGLLEDVRVRDANDHEIARVQVGVLPFSHVGGALLTIPSPGAAWSTLVWRGQRVALGDVLPPR